jgi:hypothetical protein
VFDLSNCGYHLGDQKIAAIAEKIVKLDVAIAKQFFDTERPGANVGTRTRLLSTGWRWSGHYPSGSVVAKKSAGVRALALREKVLFS